MDLKTKYMNFELKSPIILASCGLCEKVENLIAAEDFGAGAVVLKSLFEEQILKDAGLGTSYKLKEFSSIDSYEYSVQTTPDSYLENYLALISEAKKRIDIPVIASIHCISYHQWPQYAIIFENAGADAIELNISVSPTDHDISNDDVLERQIKVVSDVSTHCTIPIAVKVSNHYSNLGLSLSLLESAGAGAVVLFNRYFKPDIDIENVELISNSDLSHPYEITESLRWIALMKRKLKCSIAGSTGVHDSAGIVKYLLAGADSVQVCSVIYKHGMKHIKELNSGLAEWMEKKGFENIESFKGHIAMQESNTPILERLQCMKRAIRDL
jgi:dihydroorotate dehydrogenase (fumarate)